MTSRCFTRLTIAIAAAFMPTLAGAATLKSIEAEGTQFRATLTDGRVLRSRDLVGATLTVAVRDNIRRMRIDAVEADPGAIADRSAPDVYLHTISVEAPDGSWENICQARSGWAAASVSPRGPRARGRNDRSGRAGGFRDHLHRRCARQVRAFRICAVGHAARHAGLRSLQRLCANGTRRLCGRWQRYDARRTAD